VTAQTPAFVVEVNEGVVEASRRGVEWWHLYRSRFNGTGRIVETKPGCIVGGLAEVACGSRDDAEWLAGHMVDRGLPQSAVRIKKAAASVGDPATSSPVRGGTSQ
jgi:hypothetical protein